MKEVLSAIKVFWIIIIAVLVVETLLMIVLHFADIEFMTAAVHNRLVLVDGILLCLLLTPLLLRYVYTPMKNTITELEQTREELKVTIHDLAVALGEVRQLRGIIPICTSCMKIRSDEGVWQRLEEYIEAHSEADFSHTMCQECAKSFYEELEKYD